jgi:hypothetical protein
LKVVQIGGGARRGIHHQHNINGNAPERQVAQRLKSPILEDAEILARQCGHKLAVCIAHRDGQHHFGSADGNHVAFINLIPLRRRLRRSTRRLVPLRLRLRER